MAGTGLAAVRDAIAYLKYAPPLDGDPLSIPAGSIQRAIAFGVSQSGRFLRTYLYYGFNEDEQHRKVFDGVMAHVAGGGRGSFNLRFAQPSRDGHPFLNKFYPTDIFPFTDTAQTDPQTGEKDGLLLARQAGVHAEDFLHELVVRILGPCGVADSHDHRRPDRCRASGQHAHLHVRRRPARAGRVPAAAKHRTAAEQPERLPLVDARAAASR